jgi:hypothetical protein
MELTDYKIIGISDQKYIDFEVDNLKNLQSLLNNNTPVWRKYAAGE